MHREEMDVVDLAMRRKWLVSYSLPMDEGAVGPTEGAYVRRVGNRVLVCPWRTRLRMLASLLAFRSSVPEEVADVFVPRDVARSAAAELAALGRREPDTRSHILQANWHIPLRWFAAFEDSERILTEDAAGLRIRYETSIEEACGRLGRAIEILKTSWVDEAIATAVEELSEWVEQFPADGLLELDYGSVSAILSDEELLEDRSAGEVWSCLEALSEGDLLRAAREFSALSDRWSDVRVNEVLN